MATEKPSTGSFGEQTKLVNMALKYTGGSIEKARMMVAGRYNDATVIKGKFTVESKGVYGVFILFVNVPGRYLMNLNTLLVSGPNVLDSIRIFDGWKFFYADFIKLVKREGDQSNASYDFTGHFADSVQGYNIYPDIESDAPERVTDTIREIIGKFYNAPPSQCQIEMEPANSLAVEMEGIPIESAPGSDEGGEDAVTGTELDRRLEEIEKQAEFVIPGKVIISPVRGKDINEVRIGDNVRILLINQDQISVKVASLLNAITEEGDFLPIKGRVKEKIPLEKSGYIFYALVAKNVLAKVVEEENVKIEMEGAEQVEKTTSSERMLILYISLLVGLFLCALLIIIAIF